MNSQKPRTITYWNKSACNLLHQYDEIKQKNEEIKFNIINLSEIWFNSARKRLIRKNIDHPYFHKCLQEFFKIWFSSSIKTKRGKNQELYSTLGNINLYSLSHAICCGLIPRTLRNRNMPLISLLDKNIFSQHRQWVSYDFIKRQNTAYKVASWIRKNISRYFKGNPCLVIDYAGGNGEWAIHLSQILQKMKLSKKVYIIVKELNKGMIKEGKKRIKDKGIRNIIFINSSIEVSFNNIRKRLPKKLNSSNIIAGISSYTMGALPRKVLPNAIKEMNNSLINGGLFMIWDFADQKDNLLSFLSSTKLKGISYQISRFICKKPLFLCYKNWDHNIKNISITIKILKSRKINFTNEWFISNCTSIPLFCIGKILVVLNVPGYVERTINYTKR